MIITTPLRLLPLFFPSVGPMELAVVFTVVLILFGPGKLPDVFKALGEGVRQFKDASKGNDSKPSTAQVPDLSQRPTPAATTPVETNETV